MILLLAFTVAAVSLRQPRLNKSVLVKNAPAAGRNDATMAKHMSQVSWVKEIGVKVDFAKIQTKLRISVKRSPQGSNSLRS